MSTECECAKGCSGKNGTVENTVTAGFIRETLNRWEFVQCSDKDQEVLRQCTGIESMLECCSYWADSAKVEVRIHNAFVALMKYIKARFRVTNLPMCLDEIEERKL